MYFEENEVENLMKKYEKLVDQVIHYKKFFVPVGYAKEDLRQEGLIGLYAAIRKYDGTIKFESFAFLVILNYLKAYLQKTNRIKNTFFREMNSLHSTLKESDDFLIDYCEASSAECVSDYYTQPSKKIETKLMYELVQKYIEMNFTESEKIVFNYYFIEQLSIKEIEAKTNLTYKQIDNVIYRLKRKTKKLNEMIKNDEEIKQKSTKGRKDGLISII